MLNAAIVDICRGGQPELSADSVMGEELVRAVRFHRIAPLAHVALREKSPQLAALLKSDRNKAVLHHLRMVAVLGRVRGILDPLPWLVFKGPVFSEFAHPIRGLRFYKDLDILVSPRDLREVCRRLLAAGWHVISADEELRNVEVPGEIPLASPDGIAMDLHWSMALSQSTRKYQFVETDELLDRREAASFGPTAVFVLDRADAVVHACHHAAFSGAVKLGHLLDVDQLARGVDNWPEVCARARDWGSAPQVELVLRRAQRLFGTPLPDDLERQLGVGAALSCLFALVDGIWPVPGLRKDASVPRLVARAVRLGAAATVATALRNLAMGAWNRIRRAPGIPPRQLSDAAAIEDYLAMIETVTDARP